MDHIDLSKYFVEAKCYKTGRPRCDAEKLLKVILFTFMEHRFSSLREIEKTRNKMFVNISELINAMNTQVLNLFGVKFETREEYAIFL